MIRTGLINLVVCMATISVLHAQGSNDMNRGVPLAPLISACWNVGSLSEEARGVSVTLSVAMSLDGRPEAAAIHLVDFEGGSEPAAQEAF